MPLYEAALVVFTLFNQEARGTSLTVVLGLLKLNCPLTVLFPRWTPQMGSVYSLQRIISFHLCMCVCLCRWVCVCVCVCVEVPYFVFHPQGNSSVETFKFYGVTPKFLRFGDIFVIDLICKGE